MQRQQSMTHFPDKELNLLIHGTFFSFQRHITTLLFSPTGKVIRTIVIGFVCMYITISFRIFSSTNQPIILNFYMCIAPLHLYTKNNYYINNRLFDKKQVFSERATNNDFILICHVIQKLFQRLIFLINRLNLSFCIDIVLLQFFSFTIYLFDKPMPH